MNAGRKSKVMTTSFYYSTEQTEVGKPRLRFFFLLFAHGAFIHSIICILFRLLKTWHWRVTKTPSTPLHHFTFSPLSFSPHSLRNRCNNSHLLVSKKKKMLANKFFHRRSSCTTTATKSTTLLIATIVLLFSLVVVTTTSATPIPAPAPAPFVVSDDNAQLANRDQYSGGTTP